MKIHDDKSNRVTAIKFKFVPRLTFSTKCSLISFTPRDNRVQLDTDPILEVKIFRITRVALPCGGIIFLTQNRNSMTASFLQIVTIHTLQAIPTTIIGVTERKMRKKRIRMNTDLIGSENIPRITCNTKPRRILLTLRVSYFTPMIGSKEKSTRTLTTNSTIIACTVWIHSSCNIRQ